jgi:hypothetical protein
MHYITINNVTIVSRRTSILEAIEEARIHYIRYFCSDIRNIIAE